MATPDTKPVDSTPEPSAYDEMSNVFDELLDDPESPKEGEGEPAASAEPKEGEPKEGEPKEPVVKEPAAEPKEPVKEPAAAEPKEPVEEPAAEPAAEPVEEIDWKARAAELEAQLKAKPAAAEPKEPAAEPKEPKQPEAPKLYSPEEEEFLKSYETDWPDISKAERLKRRAEYNDLIAHVFSEIRRVYDPLIERGVTAADVAAESAALTVIRAAHPDYDVAMYEAVNDWADNKLTGVRQKTAKAIIAEGDPEEVAELISDFKTSTGRKPKVVADATPKVASAPTKVTELSTKAKQAAQAMSVVDSKRTAPNPIAADPNDFDGAWNEAVGGQ